MTESREDLLPSKPIPFTGPDDPNESLISPDKKNDPRYVRLHALSLDIIDLPAHFLMLFSGLIDYDNATPSMKITLLRTYNGLVQQQLIEDLAMNPQPANDELQPQQREAFIALLQAAGKRAYAINPSLAPDFGNIIPNAGIIMGRDISVRPSQSPQIPHPFQRR